MAGTVLSMLHKLNDLIQLTQWGWYYCLLFLDSIANAIYTLPLACNSSYEGHTNEKANKIVHT